MRFSSSNANPAGGYYDSGLFPISSWTMDSKYPDQALLNAFIRQESRFRVVARNNTGATGLMQVMPSTAAYITKQEVYNTPKGQRLLSNPKTNVDIGASYLQHLLDLNSVNNNLFSLAIAYNAGPGNLARWKREIRADDPLLFIELIPSSETRAFVERVLTNYWIYQMQMDIEPTTLQAVAEGRWPTLE
jgi:soluble lytic murein transglycosylase-like protein